MGNIDEQREQRLLAREAVVARRECELEGASAAQKQVNSAARRTLEELMALMRQVNESLVLFSTASLERSDACEAESRSKDEFLATASHELRGPLSAVAGWTDLLGSGTLSPQEAVHAIQVVERNVQVLSRMIEDLLDAARAAAGKLVIHPEPTELWRLALDAVDSAQPEARKKGVGTATRLGTAPTLRVAGDPERLRQVVANLLANAIKFTPPGGAVEVAMERDGNFAGLSVTDTGTGISSKLLPHIFERFRQSAGAEAHRESGLGLGLSIVKQIVELHGGTVAARSAGAGQGTRVEVRLPISA